MLGVPRVLLERVRRAPRQLRGCAYAAYSYLDNYVSDAGSAVDNFRSEVCYGVL